VTAFRRIKQYQILLHLNVTLIIYWCACKVPVIFVTS